MRAVSMKKQRNDLTTGPIWRKLIFFALPLLGSSLIQQLYNAVDVFFTGNFVADKNAMSAVGASSLIVTLLVGFFTGMAVGSGVVVSLFFGQRNYRKLRYAVHTAVSLGAIGGVVLSVIGIITAPWILTLMNTPPEILDMAVTYIRIYFLSLPSLILYNMGSGILRAAGDSRNPLIYLTIGGVMNVLLDFLFVAVFQWGVAGIACATLITQTIPAVLVMTHLFVCKKPYRLQISQMRIRKEMLRRIFRVGIPAGVQSIVITLSNMVVQYHINSFGPDAIAAFTAYFEVELLIYLPIVAFGQTITTFTGQNVGAGQYDRVSKGIRLSLIFGILFSLLMSAFVFFFARQAFGVLNPDNGVINSGLEIVMVTVPLYFIYVFLEVFSGTIRGSGNSTVPMIIVIANMCGLRVALLFVFVPIWQSIAAVAVCYPITWATTSLCLGIFYWKSSLRKKIRAHKKEKALQRQSMSVGEFINI